jgi:hypothetical protein
MDNITRIMDLREIGWDGVDWIDMAQDRDQWRALVSTIMNLRVPSNAGEFLSSCTIGGFSRRAQLHEWISEGVGRRPGHYKMCAFKSQIRHLIVKIGFHCADTAVRTRNDMSLFYHRTSLLYHDIGTDRL